METKLMISAEPDASKTRTWTDRSGSFKVEAEFIGLKDGKIHLHKLNGVKIAVPVVKMAIEDLEYVERVTGTSLDDDKPLSDIKRRSTQKGNDRRKAESSQRPGASIERPKQQTNGPEYDWFDFFLKAGVNPYQCERYASNFNKDSMDESVLPDITPPVLRTLGLKEGDVLRVMKFLDSKYGRTGAKSKLRNVSFGGEEVISGEDERAGAISPNGSGGGLFSGPGGALRNNTRKGRPAPAVQTDDVVDASALRQRTGSEAVAKSIPDTTSTPLVSTPAPVPQKKTTGGFDDDAWDIKPSKQTSSIPESAKTVTSAPAPAPSAPAQPALTGSMAELSLLSPPLQPTPAQPTAPQQSPQQPSQLPSQPPAQAPLPQPLQQQPTGANPPFFSQLVQQPTSAQFQQQNIPQAPPLPNVNLPQQFQGQQQLQQNVTARQRPQAPPVMQQGSLMLPPPPRPLSAPQKQSQNFAPPPLQPQLTGFQNPSILPPLAPPGQTLNDLNQMRQQQYGQHQMYAQQTGFGQPNQNYGQSGNGILPQQTGFGQQPQQPQIAPQQQPFMNGQQTGSPFANPQSVQQTGIFQPLSSQPTGFQQQFQPSQPQQFQPQSQFQPSQTQFQSLQPQPTGFTNGSFQSRPGFGQSPPPIPPMPPMPAQQPTLQPLQPQNTGPPPPVRFGVVDPKRLIVQPTGRKANLSHASKLSHSLHALISCELNLSRFSSSEPVWFRLRVEEGGRVRMN